MHINALNFTGTSTQRSEIFHCACAVANFYDDRLENRLVETGLQSGRLGRFFREILLGLAHGSDFEPRPSEARGGWRGFGPPKFAEVC